MYIFAKLRNQRKAKILAICCAASPFVYIIYAICYRAYNSLPISLTTVQDILEGAVFIFGASAFWGCIIYYFIHEDYYENSSGNTSEELGTNQPYNLNEMGPGSLNWEHQVNHTKLRCRKCQTVGCKPYMNGAASCPFIRFSQYGGQCLACGSSDTEPYHG